MEYVGHSEFKTTYPKNNIQPLDLNDLSVLSRIYYRL